MPPLPLTTADLGQLTSATPLTVLVVALTVSLGKPFLEASLLPRGAALHDAGLRIVAVAVGILVVLVATMTAPALVLDPQHVVIAVVEGGKAGLLSIGAYHLLTGSLFDTGLAGGMPPPTVPVPPAAGPPPGSVVH